MKEEVGAGRERWREDGKGREAKGRNTVEGRRERSEGREKEEKERRLMKERV